jgi:thiamine transport system substrate-binding protein
MSKLFLILAVFALFVSACAQAGDDGTATVAPSTEQAGGAPHQLKVMTHDSFAVSEEVVKEFQQTYNIELQFLKSGDAGTMLNQAILSKNNPIADVMYGVDNTYLGRALNEGVYEQYNASTLTQIPKEYQLDPTNSALPVDWADVCLNYDRAYFTDNNLTPPQSLQDLAKPEYKGLLVVENAAGSSPGLAFLLATIGVFGEDGYIEYWKSLAANDVLVVDDWNTAYYTEFSGSSGDGPRPIVVSYASSPPAEVIYADPPVSEPPTVAVTADQTCFRQVEFVGILKGTKNRDAAEKWVDFMLSKSFQQDMPLQMFVFPVLPDVTLDPNFTNFMEIPSVPVQVDPQLIAEKRDAWIQAWTEAVLQ